MTKFIITAHYFSPAAPLRTEELTDTEATQVIGDLMRKSEVATFRCTRVEA